MNIYIVYEIIIWAHTQDTDFTFGSSLFGSVKLTKNADFDKYKYRDSTAKSQHKN